MPRHPHRPHTRSASHMRRARIFEAFSRGLSYAEIARAEKITRQAVSQAVTRSIREYARQIPKREKRKMFNAILGRLLLAEQKLFAAWDKSQRKYQSNRAKV